MKNNYEIIEELKDIYSPVCIFGCGMMGRGAAYLLLTLAGIKIDFYCDNNAEPGTEVTDGIMLEPVQHLYECFDKAFVFICASPHYQSSIIKQLKENGMKENKYMCIDFRFIQKFLTELDKAPQSVVERYLDLYDDKRYLKRIFRTLLGYELNYESPKTFNEKIQWLKIFNRRPEYTSMVDKYEVKKYVKNRIGEIGIIPTIGVWDSFDEIDINELPESFVLKCTHDSGSIVVVREKGKFDIEKANEKLSEALSNNHYYRYREWPYKNIKPRIIAEKFMSTGDNKSLPVYKFFCFSGEPEIVQVIENDKLPDECIDYYDRNWTKLNMKQNFPNSEKGMKKPELFQEMLRYASILSKDQPFIRVDLYEINHKVYFSEFTFYSDAGVAKFDPELWDKKLGDLIKLPEVKEH